MPPADKLTIETPEQTAVEFQLAGIGSRALAVTIDILLQFAGFAVLGAAALLLSIYGRLPTVSRQWGYAILIFLAFLVEFGYFAFFEATWNGQTPGKRWTHLRVIMDSGRPVDAAGAILRNLLRIVDSLPSLYAVGIVAALISKQNKRVGDYAAGTVVIFEKPFASADLLRGQAESSVPLARGRLPALTNEEFHLLESFLDRRQSLAPDVRAELARQIAQRIGQRCSIPPEDRGRSEEFLEALAEQHRNMAGFR